MTVEAYKLHDDDDDGNIYFVGKHVVKHCFRPRSGPEQHQRSGKQPSQAEERREGEPGSARRLLQSMGHEISLPLHGWQQRPPQS